jgi:hypothetical protein
MNKAHHVGAFDAERPRQLALANAGVGLDKAKDRVVDGPEGEVLEGLQEVPENVELRQAEPVADDAGQRRLVDGASFRRLTPPVPGNGLRGQSGSSEKAPANGGLSLSVRAI